MTAWSTLGHMEKTEKSGSSLGRKALAVLILGVAVWLLLKIVIGLIAGIAWIVVAVIVVGGVLWALNTLT
jgi:fatty acid desaturase